MALFMIPIVYLWMILYRKYASKYNHVIRTKIADLNAMINESIQGMSIIQAFRREKQMENEFEEMNEEHYHYQRKLLFLDSATSFNLVNSLRLIMFVMFICYFGTQSLATIQLFQQVRFYAFVDYLTRLFNPITELSISFHSWNAHWLPGNECFKC